MLTELIEILGKSNKYADTRLVLHNQTVVWNLYFVHGQLLYAVDKAHPVRRWGRAFKQHCSTWSWGADFSQLSNHQPWQLKLLDQGIDQNQLSLIRAKLAIRTVVRECLFELGQCLELKSDWKPFSKVISTASHNIALSSYEMQSILAKVTRMQEQWQDAGLNRLSPSLSPVLLKQESDRQVPPELLPYLNGQFTVWDIAWRLEQSVTEVARSLNLLVEQNVLEFQTIPDVSVAIATQPNVQTSIGSDPPFTQAPEKRPLIACIDDSPVLAHTLKKILIPAGYEMLSIPEPMRGFAQLIEHQPDLILLDLLLPNADGYSVCKFLRDTPVFKETPIIILTAKTSSIDRSRARLVGATEFVSKPPNPSELLKMIQTHLKKG